MEDLSIDFLVLLDSFDMNKDGLFFYYGDKDDALVDCTVLLHFHKGSQLSDHDIARVLAGDASRF